MSFSWLNKEKSVYLPTNYRNLEMVLSEFTYRNASGWALEDLLLNRQNLVVGLNAVGKSRTVAAIGRVASYIRGEMDDTEDFSCSLVLENGNRLEYSFEVVDGKIQAEILKKDNTSLIQRELYSAKMYDDTVSPPESKLLIQIRRDTKLYPEIEEIIQWAEHTSLFVFSNITASQNSLSPFVISDEPKITVMYGKISGDQQEQLKKYMCDLGYKINKIDVAELPSKTLLVYEDGVKFPLLPFDLSNGMFRVFCVLLYMIYCSTLADARCLVIDDMGEGLDYMRSTKLGKIMFDYCDKNHIQLIATSNDSFLMDAVNLHYWNILQRNGNRVHGVNCTNSPLLFEKFQRTGLSNFDILSSNFIVNNTINE